MRRTNNISVGWLDTSIGALVRSRPTLLARFAYVLVTSLDSSTDMGSLPVVAAILQRMAASKLLGSGLVLPSSVLAQTAEDYKLFTGFDELWCFHHEPTIPKLSDISIVAPLNLSTDDVPEMLADWMDESKCLLGLGDGIGLNFVARDERIAVALERLASDPEESPQ